MTGSHFDTVRNGGRYDGRLGILLPIAVVDALHRAGIRLPYHFEVVAFAEEEGLRFKTSFLASSVLAGRFDPALLERRDTAGISLGEALAGSACPAAALPPRWRPRPSIRPACWASSRCTSSKGRCCCTTACRSAW